MTLKATPPDPDVIAWLWSSEALSWGTWRHRPTSVRFRDGGWFGSVKSDHDYTAGQGGSCDGVIRSELERYGLTGVPEGWHWEWNDVCQRSGTA